MNRRNQDLLLAIRVASDLTMLACAWVLAFAIRFHTLIPVPKGVPSAPQYLKLLPFVLGIWFLVFLGSGLYRRSGRYRSPFLEALSIMRSCVLATLGFIAFTWLYDEYRYSRLLVAIFAMMHPWLIIAGRSLIRKALRRYRRRAAPRRTLIIGGGDLLRHAIEMAHVGDLTRSEVLGVVVVGDDPQIELGRAVLRDHGLNELALPADWPRFFSEHPTESVVFAIPHRAYDLLDEHLAAIADQVADVKLIPDLIRFTRFAAGVDIILGTPVVTINESPLAGIGQVAKRVVDIAGALFGIILFAPVMTLVALAVAGSSRGPIFYAQERMGLDGRRFLCLKFRSMHVNAEAATGAVWAKPGDHRTTVIGAFLRKTSLDELPQFFNVLVGDMSLVGPRPERPMFVDQFRRQVPGYYLRHKAKAGLTGWAQVNGWRGNTSIERRIECDLYYIQNWSLWLDVKILFLTIFKGFINKNAY